MTVYHTRLTVYILLAVQGRVRVIILGALSGTEQLPPFPAATHKVGSSSAVIPSHGTHCVQVSVWVLVCRLHSRYSDWTDVMNIQTHGAGSNVNCRCCC